MSRDEGDLPQKISAASDLKLDGFTAGNMIAELSSFGGCVKKFRENESERKVEPARTEFAHAPYLTI